MLYRNLMAMEVEETLRANPIDGVVLLCNCDKTTPAQLMAAASADLPAIQLNGGPRQLEPLARRRSRHGHRSVEILGRAAGRADHRSGLRRTRGVSRLLGRRLQHDGDRLDDDGPLRSARHDAARHVGHSGDRLAALAAAEATGRRSVALVQRGSAPVADPDAGRLRQCDPHVVGTRRIDQRRDSPDRHRRPAEHRSLRLDRFDELARRHAAFWRT